MGLQVVSPWMMDFSHLTVFAGTGKTSLCQGICQQLSIRLSDPFPSFQLVKVDSQSLFSRYFSESGKMVTRLFNSIESMLDEDKNGFVCVLIDEIESLVGSREQDSGSKEPKDALRVG